MNKFYGIIGVLALLAILGFSLFFMNRSKLAEQKQAMDTQFSELQAEQQKLMQIESDLRAQNAESARITKEAQEARKMALAQAETERTEREQMVAELNARLKAEAAERKQAEEAQAALAEKMKALEAAQAEARAALAALETERAAGEGGALQDKIAHQEQELLALSQENQSLRQRQQLLEQRQISTEEAIMAAGGEIELPFPDIRSPNYKRRDALYFKQRILGQDGN